MSNIITRFFLAGIGAFVRWGLKGFKGNYSDLMGFDQGYKNSRIAIVILIALVFLISYCGERK